MAFLQGVPCPKSHPHSSVAKQTIRLSLLERPKLAEKQGGIRRYRFVRVLVARPFSAFHSLPQVYSLWLIRWVIRSANMTRESRYDRRSLHTNNV